MSTAFFISHPEVVVDRAVPVTAWHLADRGIARMGQFAARPLLDGVTSVWSSAETKALEAANLLATRLGLEVGVHPDLGENDRSATGFLEPADFETTADEFFARPDSSARGWERAVDAQSRVVAAVDEVLLEAPSGDVAIVAHGAVGTLAYCALAGQAISRRHDQPFQGHYWTFDIATRAVHHAWRPIASR